MKKEENARQVFVMHNDTTHQLHLYIDPQKITHSFIAVPKVSSPLPGDVKGFIDQGLLKGQPDFWSKVQKLRIKYKALETRYPDTVTEDEIGQFILYCLDKANLSSGRTIVLNTANLGNQFVIFGFSFYDDTPKVVLPYTNACMVSSQKNGQID